ncbi:hypothetical protein BH18ACI4_BH18ACI4_21130 [soil metagenome]
MCNLDLRFLTEASQGHPSATPFSTLLKRTIGMKRCSQCDFIYEDEQRLCDMDGHELVSEPTLQPLQVSATNPPTKPPVRPAKPARRGLVLIAAVAVLLGTLLSVGYSGFTREHVPQNIKAPSTRVIHALQSAPNHIPATHLPSTAPSPSHPPRLEKKKVRHANASPVVRPTPRSDSIASSWESIRPQPTKASHKKESRIAGFFKKTGKILKRPFKF